MPMYEFRCQRCGRVEERLYESFKQLCLEPAVRCLRDNSRMERVPSAAAFAVKGFNAANNYGVKS